MVIRCYTDGSCSGNPGPGGYASLISFGNHLHVSMCGNKEMTTNNEMELTSFLQTLRYISRNRYQLDDLKIRIDIHSDSAYVVNSINQGWLESWERNSWINRQNLPIKNIETWKLILMYLQDIKSWKNCKLNIIKVKGHSGNLNNEFVDKLAKLSRDRKLEFEKEFPSSEEMLKYDYRS